MLECVPCACIRHIGSLRDCVPASLCACVGSNSRSIRTNQANTKHLSFSCSCPAPFSEACPAGGGSYLLL